MTNQDLEHRQASAEWSNRILLLSLLGIAYLTLFPFRFDFSVTTIFHRYPFLLATSVKRVNFLDFFLNILLFIPFGFGLSARARKRGNGRWAAFLVAIIVGALTSYIVEVVQFYIPERDSGWEDVFSNTAGSVVGFLLFEICGGALLVAMSKCESLLEAWLSPYRAALLLMVYFAIWFGISVPLQKQTRLSNWDARCLLVVGNDASGQHLWKGHVSLLQIWNRALPAQAIRELKDGKSGDETSAGLLGSYDFKDSPPYRDQRNSLPTLKKTSARSQITNREIPESDSPSWLSSQIPVENLTREIEKSSHFTVHIAVRPPEAMQDSNGYIVSLSQSENNINFHLRQEGDSLVLWFRNPLSERRSKLAWYIHGALEAGKASDIVASYDGSDAFIYLDGMPVPQTYRLSPGASLRHRFFFIQTADLEGYAVVYETLIFLPAGLLIGMAAWKCFARQFSGMWILVLGWVLPAALLEILLAGMSGRIIWVGNFALSLAFAVAGMILINADRRGKSLVRAS